MKGIYLHLISVVSFVILLVLPQYTYAGYGVSASVGMSYISQPQSSSFALQPWSFRYGGDAYYSIRDVVHIGVFYDRNYASVEDSDNFKIHYTGLVIRCRAAEVIESNLFFEAKAGLTQMVTNSEASNFALGIGIGVAYEMPVSTSIVAQGLVGYRVLPSNLLPRDFQMFESGVTFSLKI